MTLPPLEHADIVLVEGWKPVSKLIAWGQRTKDRKHANLSHGAVVVGPLFHKIVEANPDGVELTDIYERYGGGRHRVAVYRAKNIPAGVKLKIAETVAARIGRPYPKWEILLHLIDNKLFGGKYLLRALGSSQLEVCTEIIGAVWQEFGYSFGKPGRALEPHDILDFITGEHSYYECVFPLGPIEKVEEVA